jgi:hypothetical protein
MWGFKSQATTLSRWRMNAMVAKGCEERPRPPSLATLKNGALQPDVLRSDHASGGIRCSMGGNAASWPSEC